MQQLEIFTSISSLGWLLLARGRSFGQNSAGLLQIAGDDGGNVGGKKDWGSDGEGDSQGGSFDPTPLILAAGKSAENLPAGKYKPSEDYSSFYQKQLCMSQLQVYASVCQSQKEVATSASTNAVLNSTASMQT